VADKPNILFIVADDIGWFNASCYHSGIMGYRTPNIDRIAKEGALFTDFYGQQSCTAGRAAQPPRPGSAGVPPARPLQTGPARWPRRPRCHGEQSGLAPYSDFHGR
jgi:hypothetical protein